MMDVRQWKWKLDLPKMTCINEENKVVVGFKKEGRKITGKVLDMSGELFWQIAKNENGPNIVQQIALAAENEYLKASSENN